MVSNRHGPQQNSRFWQWIDRSIAFHDICSKHLWHWPSSALFWACYVFLHYWRRRYFQMASYSLSKGRQKEFVHQSSPIYSATKLLRRNWAIDQCHKISLFLSKSFITWLTATCVPKFASRNLRPKVTATCVPKFASRNLRPKILTINLSKKVENLDKI